MAPSTQATDTDHEAADAERRTAAELEAAIVDGDSTVTMEQLEAARRAERFGELQDQAARRQADRDAEQQRREQVDALADEVDSMPDDAARVRELATTAHQTLAELISTVNRRKRAIADFENRAHQLQAPSRPEDDPRSPVVLHGEAPRRTLSVRDKRFHKTDPASLVARLVREAWRAAGVTSDNAIRINGYAQDLPPLADQLAKLDQPEPARDTRPRYRGEGGGIWHLDTPLPPALAQQVQEGRLVRLDDPEDTE